MNYHRTISKLFSNHSITKYTVTKIEICPDSNRTYKSEGIKFSSDEFSGEIFVYYTSFIYSEIEYLNLKEDKFYSSTIEFKNDFELLGFIEDFLDLRLNEQKTDS